MFRVKQYTVVAIVFGPQTSDGHVRIELSVKPCSKKLRPDIRSLDRSAKCAPHPGDSARSPCRVWTLLACQKIKKANDFPGRTDGPLTLATHTAMSDPGGPAGPAVPPPAPAATVWPQGADPSKAKQSKLSFARASKEQWLEQNAARFAEMSAAADAARAAEEEEVLRILEDRTAAAGARRQQGRAFRHASRRAVHTSAGLPNELHPKFELAESTAVPKIRKIRPKFELTSQSVVSKKARPKL
jgi:hypothetical protein